MSETFVTCPLTGSMNAYTYPDYHDLCMWVSKFSKIGKTKFGRYGYVHPKISYQIEDERIVDATLVVTYGDESLQKLVVSNVIRQTYQVTDGKVLSQLKHPTNEMEMDINMCVRYEVIKLKKRMHDAIDAHSYRITKKGVFFPRVKCCGIFSLVTLKNRLDETYDVKNDTYGMGFKVYGDIQPLQSLKSTIGYYGSDHLPREDFSIRDDVGKQLNTLLVKPVEQTVKKNVTISDVSVVDSDTEVIDSANDEINSESVKNQIHVGEYSEHKKQLNLDRALFVLKRENRAKDMFTHTAGPVFRTVRTARKTPKNFRDIIVNKKQEKRHKGFTIKSRGPTFIFQELERIAEICREEGIEGVAIDGLYGVNSVIEAQLLNERLPKIFLGLKIIIKTDEHFQGSYVKEVRGKICDEWIADNEYEAHMEYQAHEDDDEIDAYERFIDNETDFSVDRIKGDLDVIANAQEDLFPSATLVDQTFKQQTFQLDYKSIAVDSARMVVNRQEDVCLDAYDERPYMQPKLQTHMEHAHPISQQELHQSVLKRNLNSPIDDATGSYRCGGEELFRSFMSLFPKERNVFVRPTDKEFSVNIDKKGTANVMQLRQQLSEVEKSINYWDALVKGTSKPVLEDDGETYNATQVIVCKDKVYNAQFGSFFVKIKDFINKHIDERVFIMSDAADSELNAKLTRYKTYMNGNEMEIDMSKFDKSQGLDVLYFECLIMYYFGLPYEMINDWWDSHVTSNIKNMSGTLRFSVAAQRKSGDPWTFPGNTFFLIAALNKAMADVMRDNILSFRHYDDYEVYDIPFNYAMIAGDDSYIYTNMNIEYFKYVSEALRRDHNLETKIIKSNSRYFCSKFLIEAGENIYLVPDPVKILIKLGRRNVRDTEHLDELRISLLDQIQTYKYREIINALEDPVRDRYPNILSVEDLVQNIYGVVADRDVYKTLYETATNRNAYAVVIPYNYAYSFKNMQKAILHTDMLKKNIQLMSKDDVESYYRSVATNYNKKLLLTFSENYVPQNCKLLHSFDINDDISYVTYKINTFINRYY